MTAIPITNIAHAGSAIGGQTARGVAANVDAAGEAIVGYVGRVAGRPVQLPGDAGTGAALRVRILADETDSDSLGMVAALRARGADAGIWSIKHLEVGSPGMGLAYRGSAVAAPDLAIPYHVHLDEGDLRGLEALESIGVAFFNPTSAIRAARDKGVTAGLLPASIHPRTIEISSAADARAAIDELFQEGLPIFLKNPVGTQGIGVAGLRSKQEAVAVAELVTAGGDRRLLVQEGLRLPEGVPLHDTRHFLVDGKHVASMDRVQSNVGELRTGLHSAAVGVPHEATAAEIAMSEQAAAALGLDGVAGVDMFGGRILEVNYGPGHRIATVTGVDIPGLIADSALRRAASARAAAR